MTKINVQPRKKASNEIAIAIFCDRSVVYSCWRRNAPRSISERQSGVVWVTKHNIMASRWRERLSKCYNGPDQHTVRFILFQNLAHSFKKHSNQVRQTFVFGVHFHTSSQTDQQSNIRRQRIQSLWRWCPSIARTSLHLHFSIARKSYSARMIVDHLLIFFLLRISVFFWICRSMRYPYFALPLT